MGTTRRSSIRATNIADLAGPSGGPTCWRCGADVTERGRTCQSCWQTLNAPSTDKAFRRARRADLADMKAGVL